jgi:hypothetical protein
MTSVLTLIFMIPILSLLFVLKRRGGFTGRLRVLIGGVVLCCCIAGVTVLMTVGHTARVPADAATNRPIEDPSHGYVGSEACRACHAHEHATWNASYHRKMTQIASSESVIGEFDTTLFHPGWAFNLYREGDEFRVRMEQRLAQQVLGYADHQIVMTTGSHHMQVYWYSLGDNTRVLGMLPFTYLTKDRRWVPRNATFLKPASSPQQQEAGRWNTTCIRCHATYGRMDVDGVEDMAKWPDLGPDTDTRVAEFGISCEACHGPGQRHVELRQASGAERRDKHQGRDDTITHPKKINHRLAAQICGQCHGFFETFRTPLAEWAVKGNAYRPGQDLDEYRRLLQCRGDSVSDFPAGWENNFWPDGMIRTSGREYNGLAESPCFQRGELTCVSCHQLHQSTSDARPDEEWANDQLAEGMRGSDACTQCHHEYRQADALARHTHHSVESSGSNCYNCHMSYTTYGLMKAIRSHEISSPDVAVNLETGRPNACNQCHLDKPLAWTADWLSEWYGMASPELLPSERSVAASVQWLLSGDAGLRALMAWSYGWDEARQASGSKWMAPYLGQLLQDPYDLVRYNAYHSLQELPGFESLEYDFVGDPYYHAKATQRVFETWSATKPSIEAAAARAVLIDESGNLLKAEFDKLLEERDDYPIDLIQ